jgi:hypothetical protein
MARAFRYRILANSGAVLVRSVDVVGQRGMTLLLCRIPQCLKVLLTNGADVYVRDRFNRTPREWAIQVCQKTLCTHKFVGFCST